MNYNVDPFREYKIWRRYAYRFLPSFGGALLLSLLSIGINTSTSLSYYAHFLHLPDEVAFAAGMALCLIFCGGQIMMSEGVRYAPGILVFVAATNILLTIGYSASAPMTLLSLTPVFTSLIYILAINSKNHRRYTSMLQVRRRRKIRAHTPFP
jgi:hypothetical protein